MSGAGRFCSFVINFINNVFYKVLTQFDSNIKRRREEEVGYQTLSKFNYLFFILAPTTSFSNHLKMAAE